MKRRSSSAGSTSRNRGVKARTSSLPKATARRTAPASRMRAQPLNAGARTRGNGSTTKAGRSQTATTAARGTNAGAQRGAAARAGGEARLTFDHDEIRRWVEDRGGHPARVKRTAKAKDGAGVLRIDFPGYSGKESLQEISWDEWFKTFDGRRLGFLHQDKTASGKPSRFNKLVCRT